MNDFNTSFFNLTTVKLPVKAGSLLVAQPFLSEVWFDRAVIALIDYDKCDGATGVVLNNGMNYTLNEVADGVGDAGACVPVYCGGPLSQDRLYFIHSLGSEIIPQAREFAPGLYIGGDFAHAVNYVNEGYPTDGYMRFFIGYSGWSRGQLEEELRADTWAVIPEYMEPADILAGAGNAYWNSAVKALGDSYRSWRFIPHDLRSN